jgi:hypothetical protein
LLVELSPKRETKKVRRYLSKVPILELVSYQKVQAMDIEQFFVNIFLP